jgi:hypothetical protein
LVGNTLSLVVDCIPDFIRDNVDAMKKTQCERVLEVLQKAEGGWVSGRYFLQDMMLSQAHARIWELQRSGHKIEASDFTDQWNFKSYRLVPPSTLFPS